MAYLRLLLAISFAFALLSLSAFSAQAGGEAEMLVRIRSGSPGVNLSGNAKNAGDVNGDGYDDLMFSTTASPGYGQVVILSGFDYSLLHQVSGTFLNGSFGFSFNRAEDVNGDGFPDFVVGSPDADLGGGADEGVVTVFSGLTGAVILELTGDIGDRLGESVFGLGDVDGDGYADILAGSAWANPTGPYHAGYARAFSGQTGAILYTIVGVNQDSNAGQHITVTDDLDGDGANDFFIGDRLEDRPGLLEAGRIDFHSGATGVLFHQVFGTVSTGSFGDYVAAIGDINADGISDFMTFQHDIGQRQMLVYSGLGDEILYQIGLWRDSGNRRWEPASGGPAGDVDGDGFADFLVVDPWSDVFGPPFYNGAARLFSGATGIPVAWFVGAAPRDYYGMSVGTIGDWNGDGRDDLFITAPGLDAAGANGEGAVEVFSFDTFISASTYELSASLGGSLTLDLAFPLATAGMDYKVLISATGYGATTFGIPIPLTRDSLVVDTYFGNYPVSVYSNLQGTLDASGQATASLTAPPGLSSTLLGRRFFFAAIANPPGAMPEFSSSAISVAIVP